MNEYAVDQKVKYTFTPEGATEAVTKEAVITRINEDETVQLSVILDESDNRMMVEDVNASDLQPL